MPQFSESASPASHVRKAPPRSLYDEALALSAPTNFRTCFRLHVRTRNRQDPPPQQQVQQGDAGRVHTEVGDQGPAHPPAPGRRPPPGPRAPRGGAAADPAATRAALQRSCRGRGVPRSAGSGFGVSGSVPVGPRPPRSPAEAWSPAPVSGLRPARSLEPP